MDAGTIGAWRAELNTIRRVISEGLSTALVVEDDIDWDVSLKTQLRNVALGSRYLSNPNNTAPFSTSSIKPHSPYGDDWDILWLGYCGIGISGDKRRFRILNDPTTPADGRLHTPAVGMSPKEYAGDGTRVMFKAGGGSCSWAYAVSFKGARKLLNAMSVEPFNNGFDNGLGRLCSGLLNCVSVCLSHFSYSSFCTAFLYQLHITGRNLTSYRSIHLFSAPTHQWESPTRKAISIKMAGSLEIKDGLIMWLTT
jgi:hypothetical protein